MIKLLYPLNYRGNIINAGAEIGYLPKDQEEILIKSGAAEVVCEDSHEEVKQPVKAKKNSGE